MLRSGPRVVSGDGGVQRRLEDVDDLPDTLPLPRTNLSDQLGYSPAADQSDGQS